VSRVGLILCGGASTRMGEPKGLVDWNGAPMIAHVIDWMAPHVTRLVLAAGPHAELYMRFGPCLTDPLEGQHGPAMGLLAGLHWAESEGADQLLMAPCDMPGLPARVAEALGTALPSYAQSPSGAHYALSLWPVSALAELERLVLEDNVRALRALHQACGSQPVTDPGWPGFKDVNKAEDI